MERNFQGFRMMQYGQGFGGVLRGMFRQVIPVQTKASEPSSPQPIVDPDQLGEGKKKRKRKRVYKAPKKKAKKAKSVKKLTGKSVIKKFQVPIPPYNF
ncbi:MAG: hypothetical protein FD143_3129 [Ignavibacteria bacterium]|nr:MAG: hypothetical protein FD143_3129 [Ignavibacteria bacterium]